MTFKDWLREQRINALEDKAAVEMAKAGKTFRRSKPHARKAQAARRQAAKLRARDAEREVEVHKPKNYTC